MKEIVQGAGADPTAQDGGLGVMHSGRIDRDSRAVQFIYGHCHGSRSSSYRYVVFILFFDRVYIFKYHVLFFMLSLYGNGFLVL